MQSALFKIILDAREAALDQPFSKESSTFVDKVDFALASGNFWETWKSLQ